MQDYGYLIKHQHAWRAKPILRRLYQEQFYAPLLQHRAEGSQHLEIGSGPGFLAESAPEIWRSDILATSAVHCAVDAHQLPFPTGCFDNILGLDVLHHFNRPLAVLAEAARVLRPGGRIILVEPWITPFSRLIYTYLHQEECDLSARPWETHSDQFAQGAEKNAFDGNAAIPYLLLEQGQSALQTALPMLHLRTLERFSLWTYLLSGGFKKVSLLPAIAYGPLFRLEQYTRPYWQGWAALRALIVWEKAIDR